MKRASEERLRDIIEAAEAIQRTIPANQAQLEADEVKQAAILRWIEIIGEACNHVSPEIRNKNPQIPWRDIIGMRNRVVHSYFNIDLDILWGVLTSEIIRLIPQVKLILASLSEDEL